MKGYKGFNKDMTCRNKQYAENTVFEEAEAEICSSGMHFCENPFAVLDYYGFVGANGALNEFAEVEALDECKTDDNEKYCTKKLKIGAKIGITGQIKAFVDFTFSKIDFKNASESNTGNWSAATNTGDQSAATNTGYRSAATNTGNQSAAAVGGNGSVAIATGYESKAKANVGSAIVVCERDDNYNLIGIKAAIIDGKNLKADTYYTLINGEFIEEK